MEEPIQILRLQSDKVDLYNPQGQLVGAELNEYELNHVRLQIVRQRLEGYAVEWEGARYPISIYGVLTPWPKGLMSLLTDQCRDILRAQAATRTEDRKQQI